MAARPLKKSSIPPLFAIAMRAGLAESVGAKAFRQRPRLLNTVNALAQNEFGEPVSFVDQHHAEFRWGLAKNAVR